jgi:Ni/Co efflux regulator RcnB
MTLKKLMLTAAVLALAAPAMTLSMTLAATAQPDHRRDSTFQQRAQGRMHDQRGPQNAPPQQRTMPAPPTPRPQAAPQQNVQDRDHRGPDRSGDRGPDNRGYGDRGYGDRGFGDRRPDRRPDSNTRPDRNDHRPDFRPGNDRRPDFRPGGNNRPGFDRDRGGRRDWSGWRRDHHNFRPSRRWHGPSYHRPSGWYYRRWSFGDFLPSLFWSSQYWIGNYAMYDLPPPPPGAVWVRYGDDAVLIDRFTGEIIDIEYDFFY